MRPPVPFPLLAAMVGTAASWGWLRMSVPILIAFFALLRPAEMLALLWSDLVGPAEHMLGEKLFVRIGAPKTRFRGARQQSAKIVERNVIGYVLKSRALCHRCDSIWPASSHLFLKRFRLLVQRTTGVHNLITPSCLRAGGATHHFVSHGDDVLRTLWQGRWAHPKMLAHYLQELQAADVMRRIPSKQADKIYRWGPLFDQLLCDGPLRGRGGLGRARFKAGGAWKLDR